MYVNLVQPVDSCGGALIRSPHSGSNGSGQVESSGGPKVPDLWGDLATPPVNNVPLSYGYKTRVFAGMRPTGDPTVANYVGYVRDVINMQKMGESPLVFVADLHALTDQLPEKVMRHTLGLVKDILALGFDPSNGHIFVQSQIQEQVLTMQAILSLFSTKGALDRVPSTKDLLQGDSREGISFARYSYPLLMAADILLQRAQVVPVGKDQVTHIEFTRDLAVRVNRATSSHRDDPTLPLPTAARLSPIEILSLQSTGDKQTKMSKSEPEGAILLTDSAEVIRRKVRSAVTAPMPTRPDVAALKHRPASEFNENGLAVGPEFWPPVLQSHFRLAATLAATKTDRDIIVALPYLHLMGYGTGKVFKRVLAEMLIEFCERYQQKRAEISDSDAHDICKIGSIIARHNAEETLQRIYDRWAWNPFPLE